MHILTGVNVFQRYFIRTSSVPLISLFPNLIHLLPCSECRYSYLFTLISILYYIRSCQPNIPSLATSYSQIQDGHTSRLCTGITQPHLLRVILFLVYSSAHLPRTDPYPIISTMTHPIYTFSITNSCITILFLSTSYYLYHVYKPLDSSTLDRIIKSLNLWLNTLYCHTVSTPLLFVAYTPLIFISIPLVSRPHCLYLLPFA